MKELVNIFVGQAGIQQARSTWELMGAEHGISQDGSISNENLSEGIDRLFMVDKVNKVSPLAMLIDTEKAVIDEFITGPDKSLFSDISFVSSIEDTSSIFSRGYFGDGRFLMKNIMGNFQNLLEKCDSPACFAFWHSVGGGTGSGLYSLLIEELEVCTKLDKLDLLTYPSQIRSHGILEPYNSILAQHYTMDSMDISLMFDNGSLCKIAEEKLNITSPTYKDINRVISQMYNSVTSSTRFPGAVSSFKELTQNLIPFPRIHFPICSLSNIPNPKSLKYCSNTVDNITINGLLYESNLVNCKLSEGIYVSCCLIYRGNVNPTDAYKSLQNIKSNKQFKFVDWCPTGIKMIFCNRPACMIKTDDIGFSPISLGILSNNSSITDIIIMNTYKFQSLFRKRAFVHWFVAEGLEEREFIDGLENVVCLISDYESLTNENIFKDEESKVEKFFSDQNLKKCDPSLVDYYQVPVSFINKDCKTASISPNQIEHNLNNSQLSLVDKPLNPFLTTPNCIAVV